MYAYVVRTVEHLHAGQACRTYFRYHISARSARVIDSTRISPHVPPFHGQPEESRKATRFRKIENCQMLNENELRAVYRRLFYSPWSSTSCCTGSWRERRRRARFVDTFYRNHHHHHHQNFPSLLERQVHGNRMAHGFFIQSPTSSSFSASLMYTWYIFYCTIDPSIRKQILSWLYCLSNAPSSRQDFHENGEEFTSRWIKRNKGYTIVFATRPRAIWRQQTTTESSRRVIATLGRRRPAQCMREPARYSHPRLVAAPTTAVESSQGRRASESFLVKQPERLEDVFLCGAT